MMTPDELRKLADAIDPRMWPGCLACDREAAADFLRQCAEQRPFGWRFKVRVWIGGDTFEEQWRVSAEHRDGAEPLYATPQPEPSAAQIEAAAYERAAQECDDRASAYEAAAEDINLTDEGRDSYESMRAAAESCAKAIRALKGEQK